MMEGKKQTAEPARSRPRPDEGRRAGEGTTVREELVRRLARSVAVRWETPDAVLGRGVEPRTAEPRRVLRHEFRILACSESVAKPRTGPGGANSPVGASHVRADTPPGAEQKKRGERCGVSPLTRYPHVIRRWRHCRHHPSQCFPQWTVPPSGSPGAEHLTSN